MLAAIAACGEGVCKGPSRGVGSEVCSPGSPGPAFGRQILDIDDDERTIRASAALPFVDTARLENRTAPGAMP